MGGQWLRWRRRGLARLRGLGFAGAVAVWQQAPRLLRPVPDSTRLWSFYREGGVVPSPLYPMKESLQETARLRLRPPPDVPGAAAYTRKMPPGTRGARPFWKCESEAHFRSPPGRASFSPPFSACRRFSSPLPLAFSLAFSLVPLVPLQHSLRNSMVWGFKNRRLACV